MFIDKCCIRKCYIMADSLLFHFETQNLRLSICPQHSRKLESLIRAHQEIDYYSHTNSAIEKSDCLLCTHKAKVKVWTTQAETYLCTRHALKLIHDRLSEEEHTTVLHSHPEVGLHSFK